MTLLSSIILKTNQEQTDPELFTTEKQDGGPG